MPLNLEQAHSALSRLNTPTAETIARIDPDAMAGPQFDLSGYTGPIGKAPPGFGPPATGYLAVDQEDFDTLRAEGKPPIMALAYPEAKNPDGFDMVNMIAEATIFNYLRGYCSGSKEAHGWNSNFSSHQLLRLTAALWGKPDQPAFTMQPDGITLPDASGAPVHIKRREPISVDAQSGRIIPATLPLPKASPQHDALFTQLAHYIRERKAPQIMANIEPTLNPRITWQVHSGIGLQRSELAVSAGLDAIPALAAPETREVFWKEFIAAPYAATEKKAPVHDYETIVISADPPEDIQPPSKLADVAFNFAVYVSTPYAVFPPPPATWADNAVQAVFKLVEHKALPPVEYPTSNINGSHYRASRFEGFLQSRHPALFEEIRQEATARSRSTPGDDKSPFQHFRAIIDERQANASPAFQAIIDAFLKMEKKLFIEKISELGADDGYFTLPHVEDTYPDLMEFLNRPANLNEMAQRFGDKPLPCLSAKNKPKLEAIIERFGHLPLRNFHLIAFSPEQLQAPSNSAPCRFRLPDLHGLTDKLPPSLEAGVHNGEQHRPGSDLFALREHLYAHVAAAALDEYAHASASQKGLTFGGGTYAPKNSNPFTNYMGEPLSLMLPDVTNAAEVAALKQTIFSHLKKKFAEKGTPMETPPVRFGCMVETKEACDNIKAIAAQCDFLSFGTNDLTAAVTGLSRDDFEAHEQWMKAHGHEKLGKSPFTVLVPEVITLMEKTIAAARAANPNIHIGICGQQIAGHDRRSIEAACALGFDSISVQNTIAAIQTATLAVAQSVARKELREKSIW